MPVLPRAARINEVRLNVMRPLPGRDLLRNKLLTMIALDIHRSTTLDKQPLEYLDDIACRDRPGAMNGQALTGVLIQHRQAVQPPPVERLVVDKS